ncbi:MAG: IS110 family RNA-guided transposase [Deltaproteobacteria bacterium]
MEHVAIDLGKKESQICLRDERGNILDERKVPTNAIGTYLEARPGAKRVILETCAEAFDVADEVKRLGHTPVIVHATLAPALGVGQHGVKTDRRDAQALSKASIRMDLESVHLPSKLSRERKSMIGAREVLVASRTKLINHVRGYLRTRRMTVKGTTPASFARQVKERLTSSPEGMPRMLERVLDMIKLVSEQIKEADKEVRAVAVADEDCKRFMTMPGIGPINAILYRSVIDDPTRFLNAHKMQSYLGQTPGERSSSERKQTTGITKAGSSAMRRALMQAAWCLWQRRPDDPMVKWARRIAERRNKLVAIVALGRKMIGVLRAMWRDKTSYDPSRTCAPRALPVAIAG